MDPKLGARATSAEVSGLALDPLAQSLRHVSAEPAPTACVAGSSTLAP
jgi:hypothetical protein